MYLFNELTVGESKLINNLLEDENSIKKEVREAL